MMGKRRHPGSVPGYTVIPTVAVVTITCPGCDDTFDLSVSLLLEDVACQTCGAWLTVSESVWGRLEDPGQNRELAEFAEALRQMAANAEQMAAKAAHESKR